MSLRTQWWDSWVFPCVVQAHEKLKWDKRMWELAGEVGQVRRDDPEDYTSQVEFAAPISMVAWLPTNVLTDV